MTDSLGPRLKVGVVVPATNTSVQPEMEAMRPRGVTNHTGRMLTADLSISDEIGSLVNSYREATYQAIESLTPCYPDCVVLGFSPEIYWDGAEHHAQVIASMQSATGGIPAIMSPDAISAALDAYGARRIALITPYVPVGDDTASRFFIDTGYDVATVRGLGCSNPALIAHVSEAQLRDTIKEIDVRDVDAIVQIGTNAAMTRLAAVAEQWIDKPVISNNAALYWHALRRSGVEDRVHGLGSLLADH
ncbi:maleate cis-trans isomerase family protein [Actinopolyspora mortivallis]|uniref:Arylmalonate decarboxylase n=1 Tax=Actinopolyspora mortivallis TaxID=33906 RepID=A0A2T0GWE4_ACTMO|nr:arylmalonate decarboxylase [Actinopolyspora mortivallis]PRW63343.1 arylmalonate decarboxylase [Actinopolyspora mortivallis]